MSTEEEKYNLISSHRILLLNHRASNTDGEPKNMEAMTTMKENFQGISISVFNLGSRFVFFMLIYVHVSIFLYNFLKWV